MLPSWFYKLGNINQHNLVVVVPMLKQKKIVVMMHIAKTAGSYVNKVFENALGSEKVLSHREGKLGDHNQFNEYLDSGIEYISGHIYYPTWDKIIQLSGRKGEIHLVTAIREPFSHLVSHIKWLDHYNLPEKKIECGRLSPRIQKVVREIGGCNISDAGELDDLLTNLSDAGVQFLDNCQSRYFLSSVGGKIDLDTPITLSSRRNMIDSMNSFSKILRSDDLDGGLGELGKGVGLELLPLDTIVNKAKSERTIDLDNPMVRSVLAKRITVDLWMWNFTKNN
jgi:hypothetical protein